MAAHPSPGPQTWPELTAVTGGGGLVGEAVVRRLAGAGARLRVLAGPPGTGHPPLPDGVEVRYGRMEDPSTVADLVAGAGLVVHLAGPPSVAASYQEPVDYASSHGVGTATLLATLTATGEARRLVHVSSAEVYGQPDANPVAEDHPTRPRSPYGAVKLGAELLARSLAAVADLDLVVLRPFSAYGSRSPAGSLIGRILHQAAHADAIELADLRPVRDYVHVDDVAAAVVAACRTDRPGTYNVASGTGHSVRDVADAAVAASGREIPVRQATADRPPGTGATELVGDPTAARRNLGWAPATSLAEGLAAALQAILGGAGG